MEGAVGAVDLGGDTTYLLLRSTSLENKAEPWLLSGDRFSLPLEGPFVLL